MPKITEMFAWIQEDSGPDDEGVLTWKFGDNWLPLVGADIDRVKSLREFALAVRVITGKPVKLVRFTNRIEVETIE